MGLSVQLARCLTTRRLKCVHELRSPDYATVPTATRNTDEVLLTTVSSADSYYGHKSASWRAATSCRKYGSSFNVLFSMTFHFTDTSRDDASSNIQQQPCAYLWHRPTVVWHRCRCARQLQAFYAIKLTWPGTPKTTPCMISVPILVVCFPS